MALVVLTILTFDLHRAKQAFLDYAHYQQINTRAQINESTIEGFAAMVSSAQDFDHARIHNYAQKILTQYPYIFMFEIIVQVHEDQLKEFSRL